MIFDLTLIKPAELRENFKNKMTEIRLKLELLLKNK